MVEKNTSAQVQVLIVEAGAAAAADLEARLHELGYAVAGKTASPAEALDLVGRLNPDLVMMDLALTGEMTGLDAAAAIRDGREIPVVFYTARSESEALERVGNLRPRRCIIKPFQNGDIKTAIEIALGTARADSDRKKAEAELEKYKRIFSSSKAAGAYFDNNFRCEIANQAFERLCGKKSGALLGLGLDELFGPDFTPTNIEKILPSGLAGPAVALPAALESPLFGHRRVEVNLFPHRDSRGNIEGVVVDAGDAVGRGPAETTIEENAAKFKLLCEQTPLPYQSLDESGNFLEVNQAWLEALGYERNDVIGRNFAEFLKPGWSDHFQANFPKFKARGEVTNVEFEMVRRDGSTILASFNGKIGRDSLGCFQRTHCIFQDVTQQRAAEEEHRIMVQMLDQAPSSITVHDFNGDFLYANRRTFDLHGYSKDEFMGLNLGRVDVPESRELIAPRLRELAENGEATFEVTHRHRDGTSFPLNVHARLVEWGKTPAVLSVAEDLTERKRLEGRTQELLTELAAVYEHAPFAMALVDKTGRIHKANRASALITGRPQDEIPGLRGGEAFRCFHYLDSPRGCGFGPACAKCPAHLAVREAFANKSARLEVEAEIPFLRGQKIEDRIFLLSIAFFSVGSEARVLVCAQDVTDRRRTEKALRESEETFRLTFKTSPDAININRLEDGLYVDINDGFTQLTGFTREDAIGKPSREIEIWRDPADHLKLVQGLREKGYYENLEARFRRKDGSLTTALMSARVFNLKGVPHIISITRDISERQRAAAEREMLQAQLQQAQKMEAIGVLAGGVAHDFNNLLQAISGYTQILLMDKPNHDPDYTSLTAIQNAANRAAELVRDLLLFSRKTEAERKPLELNQEVELARRMLERTIPRMIDLDLRLAPGLWPINADAVQIEQVLLNLGTNAADAMPEGGRLMIETENVDLDQDFIRTQPAAKPGRYVLLTVSDTGHGMDKDILEKIFEPFFTTKAIGKGTGLGLASVYGIVKSHGGHITCRSEVGRGAVFKIYLPALVGGTLEKTLETGPAPFRGGTETILLVDDEEGVRDFTSQALEKHGYRVLTASSGEQALEIHADRRCEIDMVIMDLGMPGMGGYKCLCEIVRRDSSAKVLIASGYSVDGQVGKTLRAGAVGYIMKPYDLGGLLEKVRGVLDR
ncbi:MAG: PAS domain S-box protein [Pseudomonadota bacterium]